MKHLNLYLCLLLAGTSISAQQLPHFVNQFQHPGIYSPSHLGDGVISAVYRQQWLDLEGDEAPTSYFVNADLSQLLNLDQHDIGLGLSFIGDQAFILQTNRINLNFAYHFFNDEDQRLSAGIQGGFVSQSLEFGDVRVNDPEDLELLTGNFSAGTIDAGAGLSYRRNLERGGRFEIDVAALQLISNELDQDNGSSFDFQRHLMARLALRLALADDVHIEPAAIYREGIDEFQLKNEKLDLALRLHYQDRFTVGLGSRIGAEAFYVSFSADVGGPVGVSGAYETHPVFGGTFEAGAYVKTKRGKAPGISDPVVVAPTPTPAVEQPEEPTDRPVVRDEPVRAPRVNVSGYHSDIKQSLRDIKRPAVTAADAFTRAEEFVTVAERPGISEEAKRFNLDQARRPLAEADAALNELQSAARGGLDAYRQAKSVAGIEDGVIPTDNKVRKLYDDYLDLQGQLDALADRESSLMDRIDALEGSMQSNVVEDLRNGNLESVRQYFSTEISRIANLPESLEPVEVREIAGGGIEITLPFSESRSDFDLNNASLADIKQLVQLIGFEAKQMMEQGIVLSNISLTANLLDQESVLRYDTEAGSYNGEFGTSATTVTYYFRNWNTGQRDRRIISIESGPVDFIDLTALKLESMRRELLRIGISPAQLESEIAAPTTGQTSQERYVIRMVIRP